jgi:hypothetical protein
MTALRAIGNAAMLNRLAAPVERIPADAVVRRRWCTFREPTDPVTL